MQKQRISAQHEHPQFLLLYQSTCPWLPRNLISADEASSDQSGRRAFEYLVADVVALLYSTGGIGGFAQRKLSVSQG